MLFSDKETAELINATFVAGWEKVREVPRVEIDFGNGRKLTRTLNGNIATYLCTPEGRVVDIIPGLYDAPTYRARLREGLDLIRASAGKADSVAAYHRGRAAGMPPLADTARRFDMGKKKVEEPLKEALRLYEKPKPRIDMPKAMVEAPVKDALKEDVKHNETERMAAVRALLAERPTATPAELTRTVYRDILHTDLDDPFLGLKVEFP